MFLTGALWVILALLLAGCGTAAPPAPSPQTATATTAAAADPATTTDTTDDEPVAGELVVYSSRSEALFNPVLAAFRAAHPDIEVTVLTGENAGLAVKILEERENPLADVLINSDLLTMQGLAAEGVLAPNPSEAVMDVPEAYRAEDGSWTALTLRGRVIMYNTDLVAPEDVPTSLLDLTDPKWQGQVGSPDSTNGAMVANLVAMRHLRGEEETAAFVRGLVENDTQFFGGHTDVRKAVGAGELKLGFVNHYYYYLSRAEGAPVGIVFPDQGEGEMGLVVNSTNAGIIAGSDHMEQAQTFIDFMLSPEGQRIYAEQNFEWPIDQTVATAEGVPAIEDFRLADIDMKTLWDELEPTRALAQEAGLP